MASGHAIADRSATADDDEPQGGGLRQRRKGLAPANVALLDAGRKPRLKATPSGAWAGWLGSFLLGVGTTAIVVYVYFSAWSSDKSRNLDFDYIDDETFPFDSLRKWSYEKGDPLDVPHAIEAQGAPSLPPPTKLPRNEAYEVSGKNGVVAADEGTCSEMGVDVLRQGGNSVVSEHLVLCESLTPSRTLRSPQPSAWACSTRSHPA